MGKKIEADVVLSIRNDYSSEEQPTYAQLAERYDLATSTIANIVRGRSYPDVGGPVVNNPKRGRKPGISPGKHAKND